MSSGQGEEPPRSNPNVSRPLLVLEAVSKCGSSPVTVKQIKEETGIPAPTVYRLVSALLEEGFLERPENHSGLVLGRRLAGIADYFAD